MDNGEAGASAFFICIAIWLAVRSIKAEMRAQGDATRKKLDVIQNLLGLRR